MHSIIIGAGVVGYTIAKKLSNEGHDVVLIEKDEKRIKEVQESLDVRVVKGSGSNPRVLIEAGIEETDLVIAVTDSDEVNMIGCLIAGSQTKVPKKIARIRNPEYLSYTRIFEKDYLDLDLNINPQKMAAERILQVIDVPGAVDVVDFVKGKLKLIGSRLTAESSVVGKRVKDIDDLHPDHKVIMVAIYRNSETIVPQGSTMLKANDLLFAVTVPHEVTNLLKILGRGEKQGNKILIIGGGNIGFYVAENLEKKGYQVKVIESNEERCSFLAENLGKTIVINGDGTDQGILAEENISDIDTFVAVTNSEEANILTSLLAKRAGVARCISLVDKPEYVSMFPTVGIDVAVSPRLSSVSVILRFIRKGMVISVTTLMEERMEAIETVALETSEIAGKRVRNIRFPKDVLIGAVIKGEEVLIPEGDTMIDPGDGVVLFLLSKSVPKLEKFLMVKPEFF
ncbi:MAG: Trk system potassium transporter TrkA [Thermodesulfobacteriota bacterium]